MPCRWGEAETRVFVKLYLSHKCLWDTNHEEYKSRFHRQAATRDIIAKFASLTNILLDEGEVRRKIKNLRSTYCQEVLKVRTRSTPKLRYKPNIKWFDDFEKCFGQGKMENGEEQPDSLDSSSSKVTQEIWLDPTNPAENSQITENKDHIEDPNKEDPFTADNYILLLKTEPEDQLEKPEIEVEPPTRKRRMRKPRHSSEDDVYIPKFRRREKKEKYERESKESLSAMKEDEFDIYGKYIASQLREMGLQRALRVQLKIQSIVSEARIDHLSGEDL